MELMLFLQCYYIGFMPVIYEYLGIIISFWSKEHEPIHIHASYNGATVKVILYVKEGRVYRVSYKPDGGKFPEAKMRQLKDFVSVYKQALLYAWLQFFDNQVQIKTIKITKKIK